MHITDTLKARILKDLADSPADGNNLLHVDSFLDGYLANLQGVNAANNKDEVYALGYLASIKRFGYLRALYGHKVTKRTTIH